MERINREISIIFLVTFFFCITTYAQESDQQISDFSLFGFAEKGKKTWDLAGKTADIFVETIKLKDIVGNLYGAQEDIKLTADKGDFNKVNGAIYLEQNVVITTSKGARLTTNSLDWDRKNQVVSTKDKVNIQRETMVAKAVGAVGHPNLNEMILEKNVWVKFKQIAQEDLDKENEEDKTVITCKGPLKINYKDNIANFNNNVKVDRKDLRIFSDVMDVYFTRQDANNPPATTEADKGPTIMGSKIDKIDCKGNVKIIRDQNISYSNEAIYNTQEKKLTLLGRPKLFIYSTEGLGASFGD